jgi:hypothetical protein
MEIELVSALKDRLKVPIIVKFHPAHSYDGRKYKLSNMANHICVDDEYPDCLIFVSYNSFMENDYIARGISSFSIERVGGVQATFDAISTYLTSDASISD